MPSHAVLARRCASYGLTVEQYHQMLKLLDNRCPICRRSFLPRRGPAIDHDHRTGLWRGLLCSSCNYDLGMLRDDYAWLLRAATYLLDPPALSVAEVYHPDAPPKGTK